MTNISINKYWFTFLGDSYLVHIINTACFAMSEYFSVRLSDSYFVLFRIKRFVVLSCIEIETIHYHTIDI